MMIRCNFLSLSPSVRKHAPLRRMTTRHAYFVNGSKVRGYAPCAFSLLNKSIAQQYIPQLLPPTSYLLTKKQGKPLVF